jgi:hypothetical protein
LRGRPRFNATARGRRNRGLERRLWTTSAAVDNRTGLSVSVGRLGSGGPEAAHVTLFGVVRANGPLVQFRAPVLSVLAGRVEIGGPGASMRLSGSGHLKARDCRRVPVGVYPLTNIESGYADRMDITAGQCTNITTSTRVHDSYARC